ncbi:5'/3'-nucleotidase SurE [Egbenema bharatensis]|uniref:5'/3'-nucleotidase SurE n=1 Tax=Egbenema bharatensis TaxID=3463334 RepID=UPI003A8367B7
MPIILTNDDGIDAPGLRSLQQAIGEAGSGEAVAVVAPQRPHSGCGHQVTTHRPIHLERRSDQEIAVDGTPADCARIALSYLYPNTEWVLSGINAGGNLGADVYISGTVAAVREAALHRISGIALSHYIRQKRPIDWDLAARMAGRVLDKLMAQPLEPGAFWNVNLPHLAPDDPEPKIVFCPLCTQPLPVDYRVEGDHLQYVGKYGDRVSDPGSDVTVCFSGNIAVTKINL